MTQNAGPERPAVDGAAGQRLSAARHGSVSQAGRNKTIGLVETCRSALSPGGA